MNKFHLTLHCLCKSNKRVTQIKGVQILGSWDACVTDFSYLKLGQEDGLRNCSVMAFFPNPNYHGYQAVMVGAGSFCNVLVL